MMNALLSMSLAGSAVLLLWRLVSKLLGDRLPARWHYRILKTGLLFLLVPVGPLAAALPSLWKALSPAPTPVVMTPTLSPGIPGTVLPHPVPSVSVPAAPATPTAPSLSLSPEALSLLAVIWVAGAAAVLLRKALLYCRFHQEVLRLNRGASSAESMRMFRLCKQRLGIRTPVSLQENPLVRTPLATGLLWPVVVLPAADYTAAELQCLFLHELTHIKTGDLWVRFAAMLASAIHWFNPLARLLSRNIQDLSEQSCDERVVCAMSPQERYAYGGTILKFAVNAAAGPTDWTASLSTKETLERRLIHVLHATNLKGRKRLMALALAAVILAGGTAAALAARDPLSVQDDSGSAASDTVSNISAPWQNSQSGGSSAAPQLSGDTENAIPAADKPAATNGTPSEAFLARLREHKNVPADTPVLFGNAALIVSHGGTLLPDEDFDSYTLEGEYANDGTLIPKITKHFMSKSGVYLSEYLVGNEAAFCQDHTRGEEMLRELVDGDYPKNSSGESYGDLTLAWYVGYFPDLQRVSKQPEGYIREADEATVPHLSAEECPHEFPIPLYDAEGTVIGEYMLSCAGHLNPADTGMSVDEARELLAGGEEPTAPPEVEPSLPNVPDIDLPEGAWVTTYDDVVVGSWVGPASDLPPSFYSPDEDSPYFTDDWVTLIDSAIRGDQNLIRSRGGTILPDDDKSSYFLLDGIMYKQYEDKDGLVRPETALGNRNWLYFQDIDDSCFDELVNGEYPRNSKGESYGNTLLADYVGYSPDLCAFGDHPGVYTRPKEMTKQHEAAQKEQVGTEPGVYQGTYIYYLYDSEGTKVGEMEGYFTNFVS